LEKAVPDIGNQSGFGEARMKSPGRIELTAGQVDDLVAKINGCDLSTDDRERLVDLVNAMRWMNQSLEEKSLSIQRLRKIFGIQTERASHILDAIEKEIEADRSAGTETPDTDAGSAAPTQKVPGHGRLSADDYRTAKKVDYPHKTVKVGMRCPECRCGKLCALEPGKLLRITAVPPLEATLHRPERLRCAACGLVYTAEVPTDIGTEKYDASACGMVATLRYGYGMPMNRLAHLQKSLGIPLGASTQWELIERAAEAVRPMFDRLRDEAAQGELFHNDDTGMKILSVMDEHKQAKAGGEDPERTGMFTTGIVARVNGRKILLFFTGRNHAGENLDDLLSRRDDAQDVPLQMCDALARNEPSANKTTVANCLTHGRRAFYDVFAAFPEQVKFVIGLLKDVYRHDAMAKAQAMTPDERLRFHQEKSGPLMDKLKAWMEDQIVGKKAEPNSSLGKAIQYMRSRWEKLTLFLRAPGVPLTNDECERLLKTAIRHRHNSLFYKTESGAQVGDILMSLIQTAIQAEANPFLYLTALQKHQPAVAKHPEQWFPWNYEETLKTLAPAKPAGPPPLGCVRIMGVNSLSIRVNCWSTSSTPNSGGYTHEIHAPSH
jgi:hypothetical protein